MYNLFLLPDEYLEELKDQPKQIPSDENELADMVNVLSQAASGNNCKPHSKLFTEF